MRLSSRQLKPLQEPENHADISFLVFFLGWQRGEANDIRKQRHHQRKADPLNCLEKGICAMKATLQRN